MDEKLSFQVKINGTQLGLKLTAVSVFINATCPATLLSNSVVSLPVGQSQNEGYFICHCSLCKDYANLKAKR